MVHARDILELVEIVEGEDVWEMAMNLRQEDTGLPMIIWVSTQESSGVEINHAPRIKAMPTHDQKAKRTLMYSLGILPPHLIKKPATIKRIDPDDLRILVDWIDRNRDILIKYWNDEVGASAFLAGIKK